MGVKSKLACLIFVQSRLWKTLKFVASLLTLSGIYRSFMLYEHYQVFQFLEEVSSNLTELAERELNLLKDLKVKNEN